MTPKRWVTDIRAIGVVTKQSRYAATYAHKDIAFEFASWISLEFKLYIIIDYQRLKGDENSRLSLRCIECSHVWKDGKAVSGGKSKWDLKEGQDKYAFMEQCVNDPDITKVLIICDKKYADKANARTGGVGDETVIISGEVYGQMKQEKFIPVIAECDEEGKPYVPTYIKSRIHINLSNEEKYEKLLRNIYEKLLYSRPKLVTHPDWIDEEDKQINTACRASQFICNRKENKDFE